MLEPSEKAVLQIKVVTIGMVEAMRAKMSGASLDGLKLSGQERAQCVSSLVPRLFSPLSHTSQVSFRNRHLRICAHSPIT